VTNADRFKLLFGPYKTPRFRLGEIVTDEARDCDVAIAGITAARIPWPIGKRKGGRDRGHVVHGNHKREGG
jgi:hypothetical protein